MISVFNDASVYVLSADCVHMHVYMLIELCDTGIVLVYSSIIVGMHTRIVL